MKPPFKPLRFPSLTTSGIVKYLRLLMCEKKQNKYYQHTMKYFMMKKGFAALFFERKYLFILALVPRFHTQSDL